MGRKPSYLELNDLVVQGLYEAAAGVRPWKVALAALDQAVGATSGSQMVVVNKATGQVELSEQPDHTSPNGVLDYLREYHRIDPHVPYIARRPIGEITHTADIFPAMTYAQHPFYLEFWNPYNVRSFVGTKIGEDTKRVAVIALMRSLDHPLYTREEVCRAGRYLGHLVVAARIAQYLKNVHASAIVGEQLMQGSARPMLLLDSDRNILAANRAARALLDRGDPIYAKGEIVYARDPTTHRSLVGVVSKLDVPPHSEIGSGNRRVALPLSLVDGRRVLCSVWNLRPSTTLGAFGSQPSALLTVAMSSNENLVDPIVLGSLFDLTPAEVRLATLLIAGDGLPKIADALHLSVETVRTQLKSLFTKTNTHRQTQLASVLIRALTL